MWIIMTPSTNRTPMKKGLIAALCAIAPLGLAVSAPALAVKSPRILSSLEQGLWQLKPFGGSASSSKRSICVGPDARALSVIHGGKGKCELFVTADTPSEATITYNCSSGDQGLTRLRSESPRLMVVETQGIAGGTPFHSRYEARRTGGC